MNIVNPDYTLNAQLAGAFRYSGQSDGHRLRCGAALAIHHGARTFDEIDNAARNYGLQPVAAPEPRANGKKGRRASGGQ